MWLPFVETGSFNRACMHRVRKVKRALRNPRGLTSPSQRSQALELMHEFAILQCGFACEDARETNSSKESSGVTD